MIAGGPSATEAPGAASTASTSGTARVVCIFAIDASSFASNGDREAL